LDVLSSSSRATTLSAALRRCARDARGSMRIHPQLGHAIDRAVIVESDEFLRSIEQP